MIEALTKDQAFSEKLEQNDALTKEKGFCAANKQGKGCDYCAFYRRDVFLAIKKLREKDDYAFERLYHLFNRILKDEKIVIELKAFEKQIKKNKDECFPCCKKEEKQ